MAANGNVSITENMAMQDYVIIDDKSDHRLQLHYCEYDCGTVQNETDLANHRKLCPNRPHLYKCMICSDTAVKGRWNRLGDDFLTHMHEKHRPKIVNLSEDEEWTVHMDADDTAKLVFLYNEKYIKNELYWILRTDDDGYINVQHFFSNEDTRKLSTYQVSCKYSKFVFQADVSPRDALPDEIARNSLDVSQLSENAPSLSIQFLRERIPKSILLSLECVVCKEFMRNETRICSTGHSVCGACAKKLSSCPVCRSTITSQRNFIVESLAGVINDVCINSSNGCCDEFLPSDRVAHELICGFKFVKCPNCEVNIALVHLYSHLLNQCTSLIPCFSLNSLIELNNKNNVFICMAFGQQFILHFNETADADGMTERHLALRQITLNKTQTFYCEIRLLKLDDSDYRQNIYINKCEVINTQFPLNIHDYSHMRIRLYKHM